MKARSGVPIERVNGLLREDIKSTAKTIET